jgi:energy-converting hydrogenase Eha subunit C
MLWGRRFLVFGALMALISATPALLVMLLPRLDDGFFGTVAIMLTLTVTPLGVIVASVGAILLLVAALRRYGRS